MSNPSGQRAPPGIDLAAFASHARSIDVLGDEIAEVNLEDDMGLNFLTSQSPKSQATKQVSFGETTPSDMPAISIRPAADVLEEVDLESMTAATDVKIVRPGPTSFSMTEPAPFVLNTDFSAPAPAPTTSFEAPTVTSAMEDRQQKDNMLKKYRRLLAKGHRGPTLTEDTPSSFSRRSSTRLAVS